MTDSKIYNVLTHFDKVEQNRLRKYVRSPYFNVNETLMAFYDLLSEHINANSKSGELAREQIWAELYGKETFNDVRFRKLSSDLLKLVEGFLAQQVYDKNDLQQASFLLEAIDKKKVEKLFNSSVKNAHLSCNSQNFRNANFYYYQYIIEKNYYELTEVDLKRGEKSNVESIINNLDKFYLSEKLRLYYEVLSRKNLISHEYQLLLIDEIIEHLKNHEYEDTPIITIYHHVILTKNDSENEKHFYNLIELLEKYGHLFPPTELYHLYIAALNYCILKLNQGKQKFVREHHELFKFMLEKEIVFSALSTGELTPWDFKNGVLLALRVGEYDWVEKFIKDFNHRLPQESRENAVSYNLALVYFYQKRYDKVITLLQSVEYDELGYNLSSKSILLAVYYELDEDESLNSLMDSFKVYLSRHREISDIQRVSYQNLIKYTRKLLKIVPGDQKEIEKIKQEIEEDKKVGIASMKWVYEKLAELE